MYPNESRRAWSLVGLCALALAACTPATETPGPSPAVGSGGSAAKGGSPGTSGDGGSNGSSSGGNGAAASGGSGGGTSATSGGTSGNASGGSAAGGATGSGGSGAAGEGGDDTAAPAGDDGGTTPTVGAGPSPACGGGAMLPAPDGYQMIMSGGKMRKFMVRVPKAYDGKKPLALIWAMHGGGANGASFETRIATIRAAIGERAIYVYPDGLAPPGAAITWSRDIKDDLGLVDSIFGWLKDKVCYDTTRVFTVGQSSGAYFANAVACNRPTLIRAVASNGGGERPEEFVGCGQPVAAWISNGRMDPSHLPDAKKARDSWVKFNGCTVDNPTKVTPDPCVSYTGCKKGFPVHYCEGPGPHDIPAYMAGGVADFFFGNFDK